MAEIIEPASAVGSQTFAPGEATIEAGTTAETPKPAFPPPAGQPTQQGPRGIRYDYNNGARVMVPSNGSQWRVRLRDLDTGNHLFDAKLKGGFVTSSKKYYVRIGIDVWEKDELVFEHGFDCAGQSVLILFPIGTLGDTLGWMPYAEKFRAKHQCRLTVAMAPELAEILAPGYPEIEFATHEAITLAAVERFYATYAIGLYFDDPGHNLQPCDFRLVGLHRTAAYILGVDPTEERSRIDGVFRPVFPDDPPIDDPYVVIATQSTTQAKYWNNPAGWREIVAFLKEAGYRVICIDKMPVAGNGLLWNHMPYGCEDQTGDRPLAERIRWLRHAEFFVGLSSGLAWLAWACDIPVVMISGFTHPLNEFATPHRVINYHACNSCWNDPAHRFDHKDYLWCPRHKDTPRQFECTRLITTHQVKAAIESVPGFRSAAQLDALREETLK